MFSSQRRVGLCCLWKLARRSYQTVMMLLLLAVDAPVYEAVQLRQLLTPPLTPLLLQPSSLLLPPPPICHYRNCSQLPPPVQGIMLSCEARLYVVMRDCMCLGQW